MPTVWILHPHVVGAEASGPDRRAGSTGCGCVRGPGRGGHRVSLSECASDHFGHVAGQVGRLRGCARSSAAHQRLAVGVVAAPGLEGAAHPRGGLRVQRVEPDQRSRQAAGSRRRWGRGSRRRSPPARRAPSGTGWGSSSRNPGAPVRRLGGRRGRRSGAASATCSANHLSITSRSSLPFVRGTPRPRRRPGPDRSRIASAPSSSVMLSAAANSCRGGLAAVEPGQIAPARPAAAPAGRPAPASGRIGAAGRPSAA